MPDDADRLRDHIADDADDPHLALLALAQRTDRRLLILEAAQADQEQRLQALERCSHSHEEE